MGQNSDQFRSTLETLRQCADLSDPSQGFSGPDDRANIGATNLLEERAPARPQPESSADLSANDDRRNSDRTEKANMISSISEISEMQEGSNAGEAVDDIEHDET